MWHIHRKANCKTKPNKPNKLALEEEKTLDHIIYGFVGISLFITLISGAILFSSNFTASADNQNSTNVAVNVTNSCTMSGSGMNSHNATLNNGTYTKGIGTTTLTVYCNDPDGFVIYAIGDGDSTHGVNYLDSSISDTYDIATGTATSGGVSNWAMQVSNVANATYPFTYINPTYDGTSNVNNYGAVPDAYTIVAKRTSGTEVPYGTDPSAVGTQLKTTYAAYISTIQPAGTYIGKVKYTMLHPNTATDPKTLEQSIAATLGNMVTDPTSPNYNATTVDGTTYYNMQNTASNWDTICTNATIINTGTTLVDTRDNQLYTVAKTVDNKCWMTKNLNIAGNTALSADNTDVTSDYISNFTTSNNLTKDSEHNTIILPASGNTGFGSDNYSYVYNSGRTNCSSPGCYSYYSWDAATLGSGRTITADHTDAPYSICPKGWHLPNTRSGIDNTSDFRQLMYALGGIPTVATYNDSTNPKGSAMFSKLTTSPLTFLRGGNYYGGTFSYGGSNGYYWSATSNSSKYARNLRFYSSDVYSADVSFRKFGFSVRCIAGS